MTGIVGPQMLLTSSIHCKMGNHQMAGQQDEESEGEQRGELTYLRSDVLQGIRRVNGKGD